MGIGGEREKEKRRRRCLECPRRRRCGRAKPERQKA